MRDHLQTLMNVLSGYPEIAIYASFVKKARNFLNTSPDEKALESFIYDNNLIDLTLPLLETHNDAKKIISTIQLIHTHILDSVKKEHEQLELGELLDIANELGLDHKAIKSRKEAQDLILSAYKDKLILGKFDPELTQKISFLSQHKFRLEAKFEGSDSLLKRHYLHHTYFTSLPETKIIETCRSRLDCMTVETDQTVLYQSEGLYTLFDPETRARISSHQLAGFDPKLIATRVSNCHVVLVRDYETNTIAMLHVSPMSVSGRATFGDNYVKRAYSELQRFPELKNADIIVIDNYGRFNEEKLRAAVHGNIGSLTLLKPVLDQTLVLTSDDEDRLAYDVSYDINANKIIIRQGNTFTEYPAFNEENIVNELFKEIYKPEQDFKYASETDFYMRFYRFREALEKVVPKFKNYSEVEIFEYTKKLMATWIKDNNIILNNKIEDNAQRFLDDIIKEILSVDSKTHGLLSGEKVIYNNIEYRLPKKAKSLLDIHTQNAHLSATEKIQRMKEQAAAIPANKKSAVKKFFGYVRDPDTQAVYTKIANLNPPAIHKHIEYQQNHRPSDRPATLNG